MACLSLLQLEGGRGVEIFRRVFAFRIFIVEGGGVVILFGGAGGVSRNVEVKSKIA